MSPFCYKMVADKRPDQSLDPQAFFYALRQLPLPTNVLSEKRPTGATLVQDSGRVRAGINLLDVLRFAQKGPDRMNENTSIPPVPSPRPPMPEYTASATFDYGLEMYRLAYKDAIIAMLRDLPPRTQDAILAHQDAHRANLK